MRDQDKQVFAEAVAVIRDEGRYRVFADIMRERGRFPHARLRREDGTTHDIVVWCSNDYLGQGQSAEVIDAAHAALDKVGAGAGGTTDITRVWPIGRASAAMQRDYTLVLKGTIALSRTRFPRGTLSPMLDAIARVPLWEHGLEYGHGTGHGVGYFLNVHEGPQSISKAAPDANMAMQAGMITSIEPGLYRAGQWGVRIENLVMNVPATTAEGDSFGEFLEFVFATAADRGVAVERDEVTA